MNFGSILFFIVSSLFLFIMVQKQVVVSAENKLTNNVNPEAIFTSIEYVINGGFEEPDVESITFDTYGAGRTFGNWVVESGTIDHISERYWQAAAGRQSVDLSGNSYSPGVIYQDIVAPIGQTFLLSFALAGNPEGLPEVKTIEIWWGLTLIDRITFDTTNTSNWDMNWSYHQYLITNLSAISKLRFKSLTTSAYGPVIDSVSLRTVEGSLPLLDLPIDYGEEKFSIAALGNTGTNPGRVNSWFDHSSPDYNVNGKLTRWDSQEFFFTETEPSLPGISWYDGHNGIDFQRNWDLEVEYIYPAAPGIVREIHNDYPIAGDRGASYGNYVLIDHGGGYATFYAHLKEVNDQLSEGTEIDNIETITVGVMGGTGEWPVHLHFVLYYDYDQDGEWEDTYRGYTEAVDPYGWFGSKVDPWQIQSIYLWKYPLWYQTTGDYFGAILTSPSGNGKISISEGILSTTTLLELWDMPRPAPIWSELRSTSNSILLRVPEWEQESININDITTENFVSPFTVNMRFKANELGHLDVNQLAIYHWNEIEENWVKLASSIDTNLETVSAQSTEIGYFDLQAPLMCPLDITEIDDSLELSYPLVLNGLPAERILDIPVDEDWFRFDAIKGQEYVISTSNLAPGVDTILSIYNSDGVTLMETNDNFDNNSASKITWSAPLSGTYFVKVSMAIGSEYGCESSYEINISGDSLNIFLPMITK